MTIPADFQFSQGNLQDYVECARRFRLRYIERRAWPAIDTEPALENERLMQQGLAFHHMVQQHVLGLDPELLSRMAGDGDLGRWWDDYVTHPLAGLPTTRYPEVVLSAPLGGYRLVAKLDLVAIDVGRRIVVVDWKTSCRRPTRRWLAQRLQSRAYPYVAVRAVPEPAGGGPVDPRSVQMLYWFAAFPTEPERFAYDEAQYSADEAYLQSLIEQIAGRDGDDFHLTERVERCAYCRYRSLCGRGEGAGRLDEALEPDEAGAGGLDVTIDFEQIAEIDF